MKPWFKFIPLIMLVSYFFYYDVIDPMDKNAPSTQTTISASQNSEK